MKYLHNVTRQNLKKFKNNIHGGSNMTGTDVARFTHKSSRSYLNHLVIKQRIFSLTQLYENTMDTVYLRK